jgi:hypothetical protein
MQFLRLPFAQFMIEIIIVGAYFAMGLFLRLPSESDPAVRPPPEGWLTGLLLLVFVLYLLWDLMDIRLAGSGRWHKPARDGALVTSGFLVLALMIFISVLIIRPKPPSSWLP